MASEEINNSESDGRQWLVGSGDDCDVIVPHPRVSSHHCQLTRQGDHLLLQDLGSTNGTWVDGVPVTGSQRVRRGNRICLGETIEFVWPEDLVEFKTVITIGRSEDCDVVLDKPNISLYHARLIDDGEQLWIEDTGSTNGVSINRPDDRVQHGRVGFKDAVYLGSTRISIERILSLGMNDGKMGSKDLADQLTKRMLSDTLISDEENERRIQRRRALMTGLAILSVMLGGAAAVYYASTQAAQEQVEGLVRPDR